MEQWFPMILGSSAKIFIDRHPLDPVQQRIIFKDRGRGKHFNGKHTPL